MLLRVDPPLCGYPDSRKNASRPDVLADAATTRSSSARTLDGCGVPGTRVRVEVMDCLGTDLGGLILG